MSFEDAYVEVLSRNHQFLEGKKVLVTGDITSLQILKQLVDTSKAYVLTDNYITASGLAAMVGEHMGKSSFEKVERKHLTILFADSADERVAANIDNELDVLIVLLSKVKTLTKKLLHNLQGKISPQTQILLLGANDIGGKSADSLLKGLGSVYKQDSARKCTLFVGSLDADKHFAPPKALNKVNVGGLTLEQSHGLFSQGELDGGTKLLLNAMHHDLSKTQHAKDEVYALSELDLQSTALNTLPKLEHLGAALDLGCGSGVIGLSLAARGISTVVCSDISATALTATEHNAQLNGLSVKTLACNMLPSISDLNSNGLGISQGKFSLIATNPPFHEGINRNLAPSLNMIKEVTKYLTDDGVLYLVGNTCLHYEQPLQEAFKHVDILVKTPKFIVYKAYQ